MKEITITAKTVDEAVEKGLAELGLSKDKVEITVLTQPKKGLFGLGKDAVVKLTEISLNKLKIEAAKEYIKSILDVMGITNITQTVQETENGAIITLEGDDLGVIIGRRGDTLDALQYLTSLVCNKIGGDYFRLALDSGDFRSKREETLKALATKIANKVKANRSSSTLEPMNPYERRIIHSVVSQIEGVSSKSVGEDPNRKVVIVSDNISHKKHKKGDGRNNKASHHGKPSKIPTMQKTKPIGDTDEPKVSTAPDTYNFEAEFLKSQSSESKETKLYSKIEF